MKQVIFFWMVLVTVSPAWGQTVEAEEAYINAALAEKKWSAEDGLARAREWRALKSEYPVLPYDTVSRQVVVERVITFPGVGKDAAFKRVKEWAALHFGSLDAVMDYEDAESGKIILEGWVAVRYEATFENMWGNVKQVPSTRSLYFSLVVTVKDGKAKVRYENLIYHYTVGGYMLGSTYFPVELVKMPLGVAFPITASATSTWRGTVDMLRKTMSELGATGPSLERYVRDVENDYGF